MSLSSSYTIAKGSEVEVSPDDEGFIDAWYGAILLENPTKSGRKKLRVRYTALVDEDGSTLLTELVEQRFIRPVPPKDPTNVLDDFEEGSVVDADLQDGWWTGVVMKKLEDQKFLVYFDSPPDLIVFERKQLRTHLDWIDSKWVRSENKKILSKSMFSSGTMVEVSCKIDSVESAWVPAMIVKEIEFEGEKKYIVKCCDKSLSNGEVRPNITVDKCNVRPIPPPLFVEEYKLLDRVEVYRGSGWHQGLIRGLLADRCYRVSFVVTKEESTFKHSDLRPSKVWEDGAWRDETPTRKESVDLDTRLSELEASYRPKKLKIIRSCNAAKKPIAPVLLSAATTPERTKKHTNKAAVSVETIESSSEGENVDATELPLAHESGNQMGVDVILMESVLNGLSLTSSTPSMDATPVKETEPETRGKTSPEKTRQPKEHQNGLGVDSSGEETFEEPKSKENGHKRKRDQNHVGKTSNGSEAQDEDYDQLLSTWLVESTGSDNSSLSLDRTPSVVENHALVEPRVNEDTMIVLPFEKQSPVWKVFESMEIFRTVKQSPHFAPLLETREEFREGSAVGEMVKYSNLIERLENIQLHTPKGTLEGLKECFLELEKHGFDVASPISRIEKLITLKDRQVDRLMEELKDNEKKIAEEVTRKEKIEQDLREFEEKLLELRSQEAVLEKEIAEMELRAGDLDRKIQDVELEFQMIVEAPW